MNIDLKSLVGKLNPVCRRALESAAELCVHQSHYNVEIEHLLFKLAETEQTDFQQILSHYDVDRNRLNRELSQAIDGFKRGNGRTPALSPHFFRLIEEAWLVSSLQLGESKVRSGALLLGLLEQEPLRAMAAESAPSLLKISRESLRANMRNLARGSREDVEAGVGQAGKSAPSNTPALDQYTLNLTAQAKSGAIDPIRGRDNEIRQTVDILMRRRQNNPLLVGEAGVGKTAVVEGLALCIANGTVPPPLRGVSVRMLDLGLLQAGAGVRGEFENRLNQVINEVKGSPQPIILFIDEAHTLIGAGGSEGQGDAANLLKPALARGELRTIAATTWSEYKKYIEKDAALARRFQTVKIDEPDEETAMDMLRGVVANLEMHHKVRILDAAVRDAVRLSHRYITGRQLPDKAISVLDTACARVAIGQNGTPIQIEEVNRRIGQLASEIEMLSREQLTGADHERRLEELAAKLAENEAEKNALEEHWREELQAVNEIRQLQGRLEQFDPMVGDDSEMERLSREIARLEKGLEVIRDKEAMVPLCVDSAMIAAVISGWTGIPVGKMLVDEIHTILTLRDKMSERIVGQPEALESIARRIRTFRADLDDPGKPVGIFLLAGPSGVGKTETAMTLADLLYGGERNTIVVNMTEYQEAHTVSSLRGAPPGYVGYGQGGVLTEAVRRRPYSVVLLDEIEKAHPDVIELFYNVFDKGVMEDGEGRIVDFKNTVIFLTSNVGTERIMEACRGDASRPDAETLANLIRPDLLQHFRPAFLGRVVVVPYQPLGDAEIRNIIKIKMNRIQQRFQKHHQAELTYEPDVIEAIAARCTEVDSGARNIDHILTHTLLPELSACILDQMSVCREFFGIKVSWDGDAGFSYRIVETEALPQASKTSGVGFVEGIKKMAQAWPWQKQT